LHVNPLAIDENRIRLFSENDGLRFAGGGTRLNS